MVCSKPVVLAMSALRWRRAIFLPLLILVAILFGCRRNFDGLGIHLQLEDHRLSNGLRVILVEDHTVPVVTYQTWFRVGSVDERPGITGISHFFEHLMFKGTAKYGPKEFFNRLEAKGAEVNAATTRDYTMYYENCSPDLLPLVIDMEADRLQGLKLSDELIKTERQVVFEERRLEIDSNPAGKVQEALWLLAYHGHPYRWPISGVPQDLASIKLWQLEEWFRTYYQPGNATLVIVGNFNAKDILQRVQNAYGKIPGRKRPDRKIEEEPEQTEERRLVIRDRVASETFAHAYHASAAENDDSYALDVLASILFQGTTSRAYQKLVNDEEIAVNVGGSAYTPTYPGLFILSATMTNGTPAEKGEQAINELIREVQDRGVSDEEVKRAVAQLTVQLVDSVRTPAGLGQLIGAVTTIFQDPERFAEDLGKYTRIRPTDVQRVAQKYLFPNNRSVVVLVPAKPGERK